MKLTIQRRTRAVLCIWACIACMCMSCGASAQGFTTTTVQGTVYLASGQTGSGVVQVTWPAFTTANNQAVAAGRTNVKIGADGYVSVKLAPNQGATPAGLYYTAVYHLSDGTTSTEYWVVPAAAQASLSQVRAQVMPAAQAVQAVSKGYVDQSITELTQSLLTASGGSLSGPLFLNGDPSQPTQAATKRYVDNEFANALPVSGGAASGPLTSVQLGAAYQVDQFTGADFGAKLQSCLNRLDAVFGGTCDARNFSGSQSMGSNLVIATANATVHLPCATISTSKQIQITAATRNVTFHGCALRGASKSSGSQGGTVLLYSGAGPMIQVGDPTYAVDTLGFHIDNVVINATASTAGTAQGLAAYRTQEMSLEGLYLLGNSNQTGMTLDGTGNYTGGTFQDVQLNGFGTGLSAVGHQVPNAAPTDWVNASTFVRLHINCPMSGRSPIEGTVGINLLQGDGNTFTGGDVEGCGTALHLGPNAQNNTIVGLRNENSLKQVVAEAGSAYNNWMTGGTMFTGQLSDNGTRNSFLDTFHRSFNGLNGDWYGSQTDATITNHFRIGTGAGNERGLLNRYQSDYGYRWTTGLSDATAGEQFYQVQDELNKVNRLSIGQYNHGQASTNNQTVINAAGTGAVVLNGSANAGTGGVIFGSGGASGSTVATINSAGNAQFNGTLQVGGPSTFINSTTVKNLADAEIDSVLWAGATANQKESFIYKDYLGGSQWYMVKDASNNWALNSAVGGLDSFKAYQSNNSGDTYINASNSTGHIRLNYEAGSGSETDIYSGPNSTLVAAFLGTSAIKFPGLASLSGRYCLQIDNSGYLSNTGTPCGSASGNGTVNTGSAGQVAYYTGNGTVIAGTTSVPLSSGGTGATTAAQALTNLGAQAVLAGVNSDGSSGVVINGNVRAGTAVANVNKVISVIAPPYNAKCDGSTDDQAAIQSAFNDSLPGSSNVLCSANGCSIQFPAGKCKTGTIVWKGQSFFGAGRGITFIQGMPGQDVFQMPDGVFTPLVTGTPVHDLSIVVDSSVNAAATAGGGNNTFPNRVAGTYKGLTGFTTPIVPGNFVVDSQLCGSSKGMNATAGDTKVSFSCTGIFTQFGGMDPSFYVGAPITVMGAGAEGADYTGTITGIASGCTTAGPCALNVTPAIGATVINARGNLLKAPTPPWYVGNAGIAVQCTNGDTCTAVNVSGFNFYNIEFDQFPNTLIDANHSTGIFSQGAWYGAHFEKIIFNHIWGGFIEAAPYAGRTTTGDTSSFKDIDFFNQFIPFITYNGNDRQLSNINIYGELPLALGPFFLTANQAGAGNTTWTINGLYMEGGAQSGEFARFMSGPYRLHASNIFAGAPGTAWVEWAAHSSTVDGQMTGGVKIDGNMNTFTNANLSPAGIMDNGYGNVIEGRSQTGAPAYQGRRYNPSPRPYFDPLGKLAGDFLIAGNSATPYLNNSDLVTHCDDWAQVANTVTLEGLCVIDPTGTEITRMYYQSHDATTTFDSSHNGGPYENMWTGDPRQLGVNIPQTVMNVVLLGRCEGAPACSAQFFIKSGVGTSNHTNANVGTVNFTDHWTLQTFPIDFTSTTYGDSIGFRFQGWTNPGTNWDLAYIAFEPINHDEHTWLATNGLPTSGGNKKVVDATGGGLVTGPTTSVDGHMVVYDGSSGKTKDGGAIPAALMTAVPAWMQSYGDGSEGALNCTSGTCSAVQAGEHWYSTCDISAGAILPISTVNVSGAPVIIRCSASATIAGTISFSFNSGGSNGVSGNANFGGAGGGGGGGTGAGAAGGGYFGSSGGNGAAGTASGGTGGNGTVTPASLQRLFTSAPPSYMAGNQCGGSSGGAGGTGSAAGGRGGGCVIIVSPSITFTGTCDVSGAKGTNSGANNQGGGGGGAGGVCIMRSPSMTNSGTFTLTGGSGGSCGAFSGCGPGGTGATGWSKVYTQ